MPNEVIMPKVDMDMASGKLATWHVAPGDWVEKGAPLFDIETDKAAMEVEASASGFLHHVIAEGTDVPIGATVAWLYGKDEAVGEPPNQSAAPAVETPEALPEPAAVAPAAAPVAAPAGETAGGGQGLRATPLARSLAREGGVDLASLSGSGPQGRVQGEDVRKALEAGRADVTAEAVLPASALPSSPEWQTGPLSITRSKGGTGIPVVLIHGFASDGASWAPLEAYLKHRPLIRIELPSHGKSPRLRIPDFASLAAELRRALEQTGEEKVHLIGHSLGGALALALADTRPRQVESLTLIAPAGLGPDINGQVLSGICRAQRPESLAPWLRCLVANPDMITDGYAKAAMAGRKDAALRAAQTALADVLFPDGTQGFDLRAALGRLDVPARIIWGRQDGIIPWQHALRASGQVALHLIEGAGHMPQVEVPDQIGKILRQHL